ncbi:unnamed protein product [Heligmosomoides polygyrus]|uniref:SLC12 domain-containing protein n=1 Tax=Heligmosomoides polygyrus TaxID=6339 RepID=A0A183GES4_HELPZ|nr:unnamed protein product [Heligmosomoides polygyrus]
MWVVDDHMVRPGWSLNMSSESYCERMCSLMRRTGRIRLVVWGSAGTMAEPRIEEAAEMLRGLQIDNEFRTKKVLLLQ